MKSMEIGWTMTIYISVQDLEELYKKVKWKVEFVKDMHKTFYGTNEFIIQDLNWYFIYFSEIQDEQ